MPIYDYKCNDCKKDFTLIQSLKEHEEAKTECPDCKSTNVKRILGTFFASTSKKS